MVSLSDFFFCYVLLSFLGRKEGAVGLGNTNKEENRLYVYQSWSRNCFFCNLNSNE